MIEFIDIKTNKKIDMFFKVKSDIPFIPGEEIVIEGAYYRFIKKATSFYRDADDEKIAIYIYLEEAY